MILQRCTHPRPCYDDGKCHYKGECSHKAPLTNADCIRAMSDEELAKTLNSAVCPPLTSCNEGQQCIKCWIDWLQQPAEEDGHA